MNRSIIWETVCFLALLVLCLPAHAQNGTPKYTQAAAGGGTVYAYMDTYTGAGTCRNSFEYQPPGFSFADNTKYPLIIFFPGVNQTVQANDFQNADLGAGKAGVEAPSLLEPGYTYPSIVKLAKIGMPRYILSERAPFNIPGPGSVNYSFIVVGVQCADVENINNYEKYIRGYVFEKYKNKIDPQRIYITGLSLGGGKTMEFLADAARVSLIAAAAPVATGTECPYTPEYISSYQGPTVPPQWAACTNTAQYNLILDNIVSAPNLGIWFNHNVDDRSLAPYRISKEFFYDPLMARRPANTGGYFDPTIYANRNYDGHDAWSSAYYPYQAPQTPPYAVYNGKFIFNWFLDYTSSNLVLLPIKLADFRARLQGNSAVQLTWETALESHASHFEVERSTDGRNFTAIGTIKAKGNSQTDQAYTYNDQPPAGAVFYYRLKMVDIDNRFEYSAVRKITLSNLGLSFSVSPNPVSQAFTLQVNGRAVAQLGLSLTDQVGRVIRRYDAVKKSPDLTQRFSVEGLPAGVYFLNISGEGINHTERLLKQ